MRLSPDLGLLSLVDRLFIHETYIQLHVANQLPN